MRIVVTGGAGFIGSHLVGALVGRGEEVTIIDNFSTGSEDHVNPAAELFRGDIGSPEAADLIRTLRPDVVSHHAAQMSVSQSVRDPLADAQVNIMGGLNMLEAAATAGSRFLFASTGGAIYGDADQLPTPEMHRPWPVSPYGVAKLAFEHYLHSYRAQGRIDFVALRYANVYGPRQNPHGEAGVVAIFCRALVRGTEAVVNGDGLQTRDYIHVADIVRANLAALDSSSRGIYNVGTGTQTDVNTIYELVQRSLGADAPARHGPAKPGEQRTSALDSTLILAALGWQATRILSEGIADTATWFSAQRQPVNWKVSSEFVLTLDASGNPRYNLSTSGLGRSGFPYAQVDSCIRICVVGDGADSGSGRGRWAVLLLDGRHSVGVTPLNPVFEFPPSSVARPGTLPGSRGRHSNTERSPRSGIELRPGAVVEARAASGLSLAQIAGRDLTRAAIHRIEKGQSRPSLHSLSLIAERTGKPLSFFLADTGSSPEAPEFELERLAVAGEFEALLARGGQLIEEERLTGHALAAVRYRIGEAHVRLTQPEAALVHLEVAIASLDENGDPWMAVHAIHLKSSALYLMDDPESKFVAELALRRCRELNPPVPLLEARVLNHLAAIAVHREEWQQAIHLYDRALAAGEPLRNLRQLSLMYEGLGMAYHHLGQPQQAGGYFSRSLGLYTLQSDISSLARAETNLSQLLMEQGNLASAEEHIQRSLRYCDEDGVDRRNRTFAQVSLARLRLRQDRLEEADRLTTSTIELATARGEKLSLASALEVRGQLRSRAGQYEEADAAYQAAIDTYASLHLVDRLRACRVDYAEELDARGRASEARDQWRLAALMGVRGFDGRAEGTVDRDSLSG